MSEQRQQSDLFYVLKSSGNYNNQPGLVQYEVLGTGGFESPAKARDWLEQETGCRDGHIVKQIADDDFQQDGTVVLDFS